MGHETGEEQVLLHLGEEGKMEMIVDLVEEWRWLLCHDCFADCPQDHSDLDSKERVS